MDIKTARGILTLQVFTELLLFPGTCMYQLLNLHNDLCSRGPFISIFYMVRRALEKATYPGPHSPYKAQLGAQGEQTCHLGWRLALVQSWEVSEQEVNLVLSHPALPPDHQAVDPEIEWLEHFGLQFLSR